MGKQAETEIIKILSQKLVEAQKNIRILDSIKWDERIKQQFFADKGQKLPAVDASYYANRPLPFDPLEKQEEFRLILRQAQNDLGQYAPVTRLIKRQCDEYIQAVSMLNARGTAAFCELSMELYGSPNDAFYLGGPRISEIGSVLFDVLTALDLQLQSEADVKRYTPLEAQTLLQQRLSQYFAHHPNKVTVMVSDDMIADAAAGAETIKLSQGAMFSERDLKYLEVHEGWVHVGTTINGALQPYCFFLSKGSPSCSIIQEGLAVITEIITFCSYPGRLRKITNRVIALDMVRQGANFLDIFHYFISCGLSQEDSYKHSVRIFRGSTPEGGPFTKDLAYAKGLVTLYNFIRFAISQRRIDAIGFLFVGKIILDDLPLLTELYQMKLLTPAVYLPPPFKDLSALSTWMSFSLFLNKFDVNEIQKNFRFLLS